MNIVRPLTDKEFQIAFEMLQGDIDKIIELNSEYFKQEGNPNGIDYMQVSGQTDWTHLTVYNVPFIAFNSPTLSDEIKQEVRKAFIDIVVGITNS